MRRYWAALGLALCLLLGQQAAALHQLAHAVDLVAPQKHLPPAQSCDECLAGASLSSAIGTDAPVLAAIAAVAIDAVAPRPRLAGAAPFLSYHSRAPPAVL